MILATVFDSIDQFIQNMMIEDDVLTLFKITGASGNIIQLMDMSTGITQQIYNEELAKQIVNGSIDLNSFMPIEFLK